MSTGSSPAEAPQVAGPATCPHCPAAAEGLACPAVTFPHPAYCMHWRDNPADWGPEIVRTARAGRVVGDGGGNGQSGATSPREPLATDLEIQARACPYRLPLDLPRAREEFICAPAGRQPGKIVCLSDCMRCVRDEALRPAALPDVLIPVDRAVRPPGVRCGDCKSTTYLCAGRFDHEFCHRPAAEIAAMTAFQHSLVHCADLRQKMPEPPKPPARDGRVRVALFGPCLQGGGAEEWQRLLLLALDRARIAVVGVGIPRPSTVEERYASVFRALVPVVTGSACRDLAADADVALCWHVDPVHAILPIFGAGPLVVMCSHTDTATSFDVRVHAQPRIDRLAAVSELALACLPDAKRAGARVIRNALDPAKLGPSRTPEAIRRELAIPATCPVLGFVGRPDGAQKDPQAVARAVSALPGWVALFVGGPWYGDHSVWRQCRQIAGERAIFAGDRRDLGNVFSVMTRLMIPSRWESCCLVALEALAYGLPVLMTPHGVAQDHPEWVAPIAADAETADLAAAVLGDCEDPGALDRAARAQEEVRSLYALDRFGREWSDWLVEIAREHRQLRR